MRAELNHQTQSRPITAASDPSSQSPPPSFTQPQPQAETPGSREGVAYSVVPTSRLSQSQASVTGHIVRNHSPAEWERDENSCSSSRRQVPDSSVGIPEHRLSLT